ncbi:LacI family DNA-binding transcriptional regulator [Rhodococcus maanshanensis]|uniref:DNA-binding transcriptional regulator, LacI/PurR family n=1 Tax=Rhodococcus maanshanensis TaxID=183556 RepID=A0A1H7R2W3_9NOCA|nr:LacI family DNA-binding transcriptional regulator [Rhodococcus maanshanensis]SEL54308.1 DNA-binding transcriptional regulator, LacI/PurR family [Rhodococcus maanshanensis]
MDRARERRPTSADVARHSGVSRATVSYVLNGRDDHPISEQTKRRVLASVDALGYTPNLAASALRAGRSNIVLMPMPDIPLGFAVDAILQGLDRGLSERGLRFLLHGDRGSSGVTGARAWAQLRPAAVFTDTVRCDAEAAALLRRAGVRAVLLAGPEVVPYAPTARFQFDSLADCAARYLAGSRGHRRLACLVPGGELADLGERRFGVFVSAATQEGASVERVDCALSIDTLLPVVSAWRDPDRRPDAVYAYDDEFALVLIQALREAGLEVPRDIAVVGSDNLPLGAILRPHLTTTCVDLQAIASGLAESISRLVDGRPFEPLGDLFAPRVLVRQSA